MDEPRCLHLESCIPKHADPGKEAIANKLVNGLVSTGCTVTGFRGGHEDEVYGEAAD